MKAAHTMKPVYAKVALPLLAFLLMVPSAAGQSAQEARIYADPDVRISYDGNVPHEEAPIAASATDANLLYAAGELIYPGRPNLASAAQLYYSHDQGAEWHPVLLPNEIGGGWDNTMAGGTAGTDYFITHTITTGLTVYATHDAGLTWSSSSILPISRLGSGEGGWDREYAVVDTTQSPYAGRLYVAGEGHLAYITSPSYSSNINDDGVKIVTSSDGGKTFGDPVMGCHFSGWHAEADPHPVVMSDGTLVVPCFFYPDSAVRKTWNLEDFGVVSSSDGGRSFSPYHSVGYKKNRGTAEEGREQLQDGNLLLGGAALTALGVSPSTAPYPNRLYITWSTFDTPDRLVMYLSHSDDRGVTWSTPKAIYPVSFGEKNLIRESVPMLAVNNDGVVGIAWFDARDAQGSPGYDIYFTASLDGGASFLPPVRISSATSYPMHGDDIVPRAVPSDDDTITPERAGLSAEKNEKSIQLTTPVHGRSIGGDYSTMAVDAGGAFHPMWPDARDGTWQLYTSTIRVMPPSEIPQASIQNLRSCQLGAHLRLIMGAPELNVATQEATFFVKLENTSNETLVHPVILHITAQPRRNTHPPGAIFDPATGSFSKDVDITYPISPDRPLFPNSVTVPETWRLQGAATLGLKVTITGVAQQCGL